MGGWDGLLKVGVDIRWFPARDLCNVVENDALAIWLPRKTGLAPLNPTRLVSRQLLQQCVEVFQFGVFDDDFAAAVVVFNVDF